MILSIEASKRNPVEDHRHNLVDSLLSADPTEACEQTRRFLAQGYWVEIFHEESKELVGGPFDPDQPAPSFIL